jgi:hypothetical protein
MVLETDQPVDAGAVEEIGEAAAVTSVRVVPAV